ncbi:MAG: hypothetical protein ACYTHK_05975 [Planctomycetota bacterium]
MEIDRPTTRVRVLLYGVLPLLLVGGMVLGYHSPLRGLIAPDSDKEFGLLENLQNLMLIGIVAVGIAGFRRKQLQWERICLLLVIAGALFMLAEETDYGFQYVGDRAVNIHEVGSIEATLEHIARFGGLIFFGGFAILFAESRKPLLRYLAPDRYAVLTILLVTACWEVAIRLPETEGSLAGHEIEYAELGVYYLILLYLWDLVFWRRYP